MPKKNKPSVLDQEVERILSSKGEKKPYDWPEEVDFHPETVHQSKYLSFNNLSLTTRSIIGHFTEYNRIRKLTKKELIEEALYEFLLNHKEELVTKDQLSE